MYVYWLSNGDTIPSYIVLGHESLEGEWDKYHERFPESARMTDIPPEYFASQLQDEQCLVEFAQLNAQDRSNSPEREKVVMQMPCEYFSTGKTFRLLVYSYCVERFGKATPDFYSSLPYRHASITENERY